jgi:Vitamin K epoxide reductase family
VRASAAPPGWHDNPTAWRKRLRIASLALAGLGVSGYLTLYQLGLFQTVWDPFFGNGSRAVLDWTHPFPDGALGVAAYGAEVALSFIGGPDRWRTLPWTVIAFGIVIVSGAVTSVALMIVQPVAVGHWCTLCLCSAALSLMILPLGIDEPLAGLQHLARVRASGGPTWGALSGRARAPRVTGGLEATH